MQGYDLQVSYSWENKGGDDGSTALVATMVSTDGQLAGGQPIEVRRYVERASGQLVAKSTVGGVSYVRRYQAVE